ncbi:MAG TPA: hypothetical protein VG317_09765 [Pseudonocardiaceae bacterium]|nr:hypothetical protein [Pseudonocardiaceae bacterium]
MVLALAVLAVAALPLSLSGPGWLRLLVIGVFLLLGPGTATLLLLRWPRFGYHGPDAGDPPAAAMMLPLAISLAMATSLAISTVVATVMLYAHAWHPAAGVMLLAVLVLLALVFDPQGIRRREARS